VGKIGLSGLSAALQNVRENDLELTGWLEYFVAGLATQLNEVEIRGKSALQIDILAKKHHLNERQNKALRYLLQHESLNIQDYEELCPNVSRRTLQRDLQDLREQALIREMAQTPTDPDQTYTLNLLKL